MTELQEFGEELRKMRKEMGMTQEKLAEKLDIDAYQLSRYEKGHREMGALLYTKLLKLHDEALKKKEENLMIKLMKASPKKREAALQMIEAMLE